MGGKVNRRTWALSVLGLEPGAPDSDIREAYRDLVSVWHPDKHTANERIRKRAEEAMKRINTARDILLGASTEEPSWGPEPGWEPPKETETSVSAASAREAHAKEQAAHPNEETKVEEPPNSPPSQTGHRSSTPQGRYSKTPLATIFFCGLALVLSSKLLYNLGVGQVEAWFSALPVYNKVVLLWSMFWLGMWLLLWLLASRHGKNGGDGDED